MGICDRIWQNIESAITFLSGALTKYNALYLLSIDKMTQRR
jgi:hypothetical protein